MLESKGLHHFHKRKRMSEKGEPYPNPNKWKRLMDKLIYFVAIFGPVMSIPQILKIWLHKSAAGISEITWSSYLLISIFWLIYGAMHKDKPIIFANILWIVINTIIIIGVVVYG